jgi:hypothetical protein
MDINHFRVSELKYLRTALDAVRLESLASSLHNADDHDTQTEVLL